MRTQTADLFVGSFFFTAWFFLYQVFHILAVPAIVMGFITVWDSRNMNVPPIANFWSLHSWMGLTTMGLFAIQVVRMVIELVYYK